MFVYCFGVSVVEVDVEFVLFGVVGIICVDGGVVFVFVLNGEVKCGEVFLEIYVFGDVVYYVVGVGKVVEWIGGVFDDFNVGEVLCIYGIILVDVVVEVLVLDEVVKEKCVVCLLDWVVGVDVGVVVDEGGVVVFEVDLVGDDEIVVEIFGENLDV